MAKTKSKRRYNGLIPDTLKQEIVQLYITKQRTEKSLAAEFNVSCATIQNWKRIFAVANSSGITSRPDATRPDATAAEAAVASPTSTKLSAAMEQYKAPENLPDDPETLKKMVLELHYKVHSRDVMIDIAEETFGISIKKKRGTKQ